MVVFEIPLPAQAQEEADEGSGEEATHTDLPPVGQPIPADEERPLPDYDGRGDDPTSVGRALLWIPRILFSPLWVVTEFVLRRPLGFIVSRAEEAQIPARIQEFFTFGPERSMALVPTFLVDFGFRPSFGLYYRYNDAFFEGNKIRFHGAFGVPEVHDWLTFTLADRYEPEDASYSFGIRGEFTRRPDYVFYGIGTDIDDELKSRYASDIWDLSVRFAEELGPHGSVAVWAGIRSERFDGDRQDTCCGVPLEERVLGNPDRQIPPGQFPDFPPGFEDGYFSYRHGVRLELDSRGGLARSGVRVEAMTEIAFDLEEPSDRSWIKYGGAVTGILDVTGDQNVLLLSLGASFSEPLRGEVPFTQLADISGDGPMRGFLPKRLIGESGISLSLEYRWPIYTFLDATAHLALGNVFDEHLDGFELDRLRMSFAVGLAAVSGAARDHFFSLLVGFGTDELGQGASVESFRLVIGGTRAF